MKNSQKLTLSLITILAALTFTQCKDAKDAAITKILEVQANTINKQCPIQLNATVRIDSCKIMEKKTLKTFATMSYVNAKDFKADEFESLSKPGLVYTIQTAEDLKQARENEVIFIYSYYDDAGKLLGEITISPEDYNKPIDEVNKGDLKSMSDTDINNTLAKVVSGIKAHLPMIVNGDIDLIDCQSHPGKILEYTYCLKNESIAKFDSITFKKNSKAASLDLSSTNAEIKAMIDAGVICRYIYKDKNSKYLCSFDISASDF